MGGNDNVIVIAHDIVVHLFGVAGVGKIYRGLCSGVADKAAGTVCEAKDMGRFACYVDVGLADCVGGAFSGEKQGIHKFAGYVVGTKVFVNCKGGRVVALTGVAG